MTRALPLPPDDRRQALIDATLPLLLKQGPHVTTREIARAAGIAEGTIFGVFETKQELIETTVAAALSPAAEIAALEKLPRGEPLEQRVHSILELIGGKISRVRSLFSHLPPREKPARGETAHRHGQCAPTNDPHELLTDAVMAALTDYQPQLQAPLDLAARTLMALAFAASYPMLDHLPAHKTDELTLVALHGLAKDNARQGAPAPHSSPENCRETDRENDLEGDS